MQKVITIILDTIVASLALLAFTAIIAAIYLLISSWIGL